MVACTPLGLPYQQGTDAPCDLSEIWCLFADVVEANLVETQNIVNRTAVGVPMAKVERSNTFPAIYNAAVGVLHSVIPFDGVVVDNDNMANLAADPYRVFPHRAGLWDVVASLSFLPAATQTDVACTILYSASTVGGARSASTFVVPGPANATTNVHGRFHVTEAELAGMTTPAFSLYFSWEPGTPTTPLTLVNAKMHALWTADA